MPVSLLLPLFRRWQGDFLHRDELVRRLGHRSQRYIPHNANRPQAVAASYVEEF